MEQDSTKLSFLDSIHSGILIVNEELTVYFWNKWLEARTNISKDEITEENLLDFFHYIDEEQLKRKIKFVKNFKSQSFYSVNPHRFLIDIKLNNITNKVFDLMQQNVILSPFTYNDEDLIIIQIYDVTELEAVNLKLNIEKNENEIILNSQTNLILIANEKDIIQVNKPTLDFFDFKDFDDFKKNSSCICDYFIKEIGYFYKKDCKDDCLNIILENQNRDYLVKIKDKNSNIHIFKLDVSFATIQTENIYVITLTDVTELENNKQKLLVVSKNAAMGEMISMIAHQWRQPLATVAANISNLKVQKELGMLTDTVWNKKIGNINDSLQYMSRTIDDFRDFFKNEDILKEVSLKSLIEKPFKIIEPSYDSNRCKCTFTYNVDENQTILTYPNKFDQVILNIFKNSLDEYISKNIDGSTEVNVNFSNGRLIIEIRDNAGGIPENLLEKIWEPYFSTKSLNGTGIGLYMVKTIVEQQLDGNIKIQNINDNNFQTKGIVCTITLPKFLRSYDVNL